MSTNRPLPTEVYGLPSTDHSKWRLITDQLGAQKWSYGSSSEQSKFVEHLLKLPNSNFIEYQEEPSSAHEGARRAFEFLSQIQDDKSGIFPCQYGGPMFMLIGYITVQYLFGIPFKEEEKIEITRYIVNKAHPVDGGWGLHMYDKSTCFGTSINYVILRLLGMDKEHPVMVRARQTLRRLGGAIGAPHWGKLYLSILNLYKYEGINPAPPEFWFLPYWVPIHPGRWWVHTRAVYLPMGYICANRIQAELTPLLEEIREEIYLQDYDSIDFSRHRNTVCKVDLYYPHSKLLDTANWFLAKWENLRPQWALEKANSYVYDLVMKDMENTDYLAIAPVSHMLNSIVIGHRKGKDSEEFQRVKARWPEALFMSPEGMMMCGTNGVQVWDVAFALQYCIMAGLGKYKDFHPALVKGYRFLAKTQFTEDTVPGSFRDHRIGGWPFSNKPQGFTVSDCTAEALKAIIMVQNVSGLEYLKSEFPEKLMHPTIDLLLNLQNVGNFHFGSFATYEKIKAPEFLEKLNPAEVFGNIMVEYPYVECTDSSVLGLKYFRDHSSYRRDDIDTAIENAINYILRFQRPDGSWYGSWGVCFSYAGMFAIEALSTVGYNYKNSEAVQKACHFFIDRQEEDGGWSETFRSCEMFSYVRGAKSMVVQTSWVLILLLLAEYPDTSVIEKGIKFLLSMQNKDGSYDYQEVEGVFNHTCAIEYPNYKYYFPMKALGIYAEKFEKN